MRLEFTKMEGLGNDYIYVDARRFHVEDPSALAVRLSDRHFGVGANGLVLIGESSCADFSMRMFNADGSEAQMCGNASRCVGKYVYDKGLTRKRTLNLETLAGVRRLSLHLGPDGFVADVTVEMGEYVIEHRDLEVEAAGTVFHGTVVNVGNPHFVVFCDDAEAVDLQRVGFAIECHPLFPDRINVEFASVLSTGSLRMRVWERGSGETLACGTGACAAVAAAVESGLTGFPVVPGSPVILSEAKDLSLPSCTVIMDGGALQVTCADGALLMRGPARTVFEGEVEV